MQGEHHDIDHEFPEYHEKLEALRTSDSEFDELVTRHDDLDNEIRRLEERQTPTSDQEIEKMKFQRTAMKDDIYQKLRLAEV